MDKPESELKQEVKIRLFKKSVPRQTDNRSPAPKSSHLATLQIPLKQPELRTHRKASERTVVKPSPKLNNLPIKSAPIDNVKVLVSERAIDPVKNIRSIRKSSQDANQELNSPVKTSRTSNSKDKYRSNKSSGKQSKSIERSGVSAANQLALILDLPSTLSASSFLSIRNGYFCLFTMRENKPLKPKSIEQNFATFSEFNRSIANLPNVKKDFPDKSFGSNDNLKAIQEENNLRVESLRKNCNGGLASSHGNVDSFAERIDNNGQALNAESREQYPSLFSDLVAKQQSMRDLELNFFKKMLSNRQNWLSSDRDLEIENISQLETPPRSSFFKNVLEPNEIPAKVDTFASPLSTFQGQRNSHQTNQDSQEVFVDRFVKFTGASSQRFMSNSSDYLSGRSLNPESTYCIDNIKSLNLFLEKPKVESQIFSNTFTEVEPKQICESVRSIDSEYHNPFRQSFRYQDLVSECEDRQSDLESSEKIVVGRHSRLNDKESAPSHPEEFKKRGSLVETESMNYVTQIALQPFRNCPENGGLVAERCQSDALLSGENPSLDSSPRRLPSHFSSFKELELYNPADEFDPYSSQMMTNNSLYSQRPVDVGNSLNGNVNLFKLEPRTDCLHMSLALNRRNDKDFDSMRNAQEEGAHGHAFSFRMNL